ncbi:hypothetical protein [Actinoplanes sp. NPDC049316]|uniref:hypothetical protein n=1 Tax=Actinoplanes sp. NPDC049316 TaxID=3154727 RepID=UPI003412056B
MLARRKALLTLFATVAALLSAPGAAEAAEAPAASTDQIAAAVTQAPAEPWVPGAGAPAAGSGKMIEVGLGLDCGKLVGKARTYATEHDICPDGPSANTVTEGPCGKAWLFVVDDVPGDRIGRINFGATSTLGPIAWRNFYVPWAYTPQGAGLPETGTIADVGAVFSSTYDISYVRGGLLGTAGAQLTGNVLLAWGATCSVLPPYPQDFKPVT